MTKKWALGIGYVVTAALWEVFLRFGFWSGLIPEPRLPLVDLLVVFGYGTILGVALWRYNR